jgi:hypothetical protein
VSKKITLPLITDEVPAPAAKATKPSIAVARARLGGKPDGDEPAGGLAAGQLVTFSPSSGGVDRGVVLYASSVEVHVLLDSARLRRFAPGDLAVDATEPTGELAKIAADARVFALLAEGHPVRYASETSALHDGTLIEKCRYGALVLKDDGGIVAVGFRKLWPSPPNVGHA